MLAQELLDYSGKELAAYISKLPMAVTVIQVISTSKLRMNERTGIEARDYVVVYTAVES